LIKKLIPAFLMCFVCAAAYGGDDEYVDASGVIRIGIAHEAKVADIDINGKAKIVDMSNGKQREVSHILSVKAYQDGDNKLKIGKYSLGSMARLTPLEGEDRLRLNGKSYRGSLLVKANQNKTITVIEELGIEDYIKGVLPAEMGNGWPLEALKAQAVAARTYALYSLKRFDSDGFDLSADVRSQAYAGAASDRPEILEAVRSTDSEVLSYKGEILHAFYHANCGGHTAPANWGNEHIKPLSGVVCRYCSFSPSYSWTLSFTQSQILKFLASQGYEAQRVKSIRITSRNKGQRAEWMRITTDEGSADIPVKDFRRWAGGNVMKSTYIISISSRRGKFEIRGRGYGHGVGMCQDGAKGMARKGSDYERILRYYYPGADISSWKD